jgi:hypothetical protein
VVAHADSAEAQQSPPPETVEDAVAVAYGVTSYQTAHYQLNYGSVALSNHLWLQPGIELGAGFRVGFASRLEDGYCFEGFGSLGLVPHFDTAIDAAGRSASWRPALGFEIGATSANRDFTTTAPNSAFRDGPTPSGVYGALAARPLRFRLSGFNGSLLGIAFGTMLGQPGRQLRAHLEAVQIAAVF